MTHVCDFHLKYATGLARGMADAGCDTTLVTRTHDLEFGGVEGAMKAYVAQVGDGRIGHYRLPGSVRDSRYARAALALRHELRQRSASVIHFQEGVTNDPRLMLSSGIPVRRYALTVHDAEAHPGDDWSPAQRWARSLVRSGAGVIFVHSDSIREQLQEVERLPLPPVEVVPHGVGRPQVAPLPTVPSLLFFGRISTYYKGLDVLLDAMPIIWERLPNATLKIAGPGDIESHEALDDARILVRNEYVADEDVPALFAEATCCVLPYREASQSGVGSQAKAFGRGIVATAVGGLPDLVADGSGCLVPPGDPSALASALIDVLDSPETAAEMSGAAVESVVTTGWRPVAAQTLEAYGRHLAPRRTAPWS